jgi:hypothetical protein
MSILTEIFKSRAARTAGALALGTYSLVGCAMEKTVFDSSGVYDIDKSGRPDNISVYCSNADNGGVHYRMALETDSGRKYEKEFNLPGPSVGIEAGDITGDGLGDLTVTYLDPATCETHQVVLRQWGLDNFRDPEPVADVLRIYHPDK